MSIEEDELHERHLAPFVDIERDRIEAERSDERFDRVAFAMMALDRLPPRLARVAVFESRSGRGVQIDEGLSWATLSIPVTASRRAIVHAVAAIARAPIPPFSLAAFDAVGWGAFPYR